MRLAASLASAPLTHLAKTVQELESAGADFLHFDIEDGSFVPCMNLGTRIISQLRPLTRLPFDVHLMMVNPEWLMPELKQMGADRVSVHYEACAYPRRTLRLITDVGLIAGLAFNPATPIPDLSYLRPHLSFVLVLTTEPEVPDAPYLPRIVDKVREGKQGRGGLGLEWDVDGGVTPLNAAEVREAGADVIVAGRGLFADGELARNAGLLRAAAN
jgi:ribulose-phosphate 3-epimerase